MGHGSSPGLRNCPPAQDHAVGQFYTRPEVVEEQELAAVDVHAGSVFSQVRRDHQLNPVLLEAGVIAGFAAVCSGIDRYLNYGAGSTGVAKQVNDCPAALFLDVGDRTLSQGYVHVIPSAGPSSMLF